MTYAAPVTVDVEHPGKEIDADVEERRGGRSGAYRHASVEQAC